MFTRVYLILTCLVVLICHSAYARTITIGSAQENGLYYFSAKQLCRMIDAMHDPAIDGCRVVSTQGSRDNLLALRDNVIDFAITQSDWAHYAYMGSHGFARLGPNKKVRMVMSLYMEPFLVLSEQATHFANVDDLLGKRLSIGRIGSGARGTFERLLQTKRISMRDFASLDSHGLQDSSELLCQHKLDAMVYSTGSPNRSLQRLVERCHLQVLDIAGTDIQKLMSQYAYYHPMTIAAQMYGNKRQVSTFGTRALLVANNSLSTALVRKVTKQVMSHLQTLQKAHPAFASLKRQQMARAESIPLHRAAKQYFQQKHLISA